MFVLEIFYSEEDNGYIAIIPELPGCSAFGETEEKALEEIKMAMELWLETAKTSDIPETLCAIAFKNRRKTLWIR